VDSLNGEKRVLSKIQIFCQFVNLIHLLNNASFQQWSMCKNKLNTLLHVRALNFHDEDIMKIKHCVKEYLVSKRNMNISYIHVFIVHCIYFSKVLFVRKKLLDKRKLHEKCWVTINQTWKNKYWYKESYYYCSGRGKILFPNGRNKRNT